MNKVIILDDRPERRKVLLSYIELQQIINCETQGWLTFVTELPTSQDELEIMLSQYSMIAIHRSWMSNHGVENLFEEYINNSGKYYIVYSGGISQNLLLNTRMRLNMNAANFYSANLPIIIKRYVSGESVQPLLELLYGESWRLSLLLEYRNLIWLGGSNYDFKKEYELRELIVVEGNITQNQLTEEWIEKEIEKETYKYILL